MGGTVSGPVVLWVLFVYLFYVAAGLALLMCWYVPARRVVLGLVASVGVLYFSYVATFWLLGYSLNSPRELRAILLAPLGIALLALCVTGFVACLRFPLSRRIRTCDDVSVLWQRQLRRQPFALERPAA